MGKLKEPKLKIKGTPEQVARAILAAAKPPKGPSA